MNIRTLKIGSIVLGAAMLVVACGGKGAGTGSGAPVGGGSCGVDSQKQFVLSAAREWYLFPELLPASIDPASFPTVTQFLDALTATARAQSRDRFFSYATSIQAEQALLGSGESAGFGFSVLTRTATAQAFLAQVFEGSAAADAGLARGDEILAVGTSAATLQTVTSLLATPDGLTNAFGPSTAGTARTLRWRNVAGTIFEREVVKRTFTITPVPAAQVRLIPRAGLAPIGHLTLRTFISTSDAQLRAAFDTFRQNNVRDVIIDLRYNGGGLVSTAELLLNLLGGTRTNEVSYATQLNAAKSGQAETIRFRQQSETIPTMRIAFVTTGQSASASELVINSMFPYAQVAVVGERTFGKPVGQFAFDVASCDFRLRLVSFRSVNRNGDGDYYTGLPSPAFTAGGGASCAATDDLTRLPGDSSERMTAEALFWLNNNRCTGAGIADAGGGGIQGSGGGLQKTAADAGFEPANRPELNDFQILVPGGY